MKISRFALVLLLVLTFGSIGCAEYSKEGQVTVETHKGAVAFVHRPGENFYVWYKWYTETFPVDVKPWSEDIDVYTGTKDNATVKLKIRVSASIPTDFTSIAKYFAKFGTDQEDRHARRLSLLSGALQGAAREAVNNVDAYSLYAAQGGIQDEIKQKMSAFIYEQTFCVLQDLQIVERPDFTDDRIENAASGVVAAKKEREEAAEKEQAAIVKKRTAEIENSILRDSPQAYEIRILEKKKEIAEAWSKHQGTLIFGGNSQVQIPVP